MRAAGFILGVTMLVAGCHQPIKVETRNRLAMDGVVETNNRLAVDGVIQSNNKVVMEMAAHPDGGEVTAVSLVRGKKCEGPRIAVVDVDGLLLNQEFTGPMSMGENPLALFREKLDAIAADSMVRAVVLRINSPGGSVTASDILRHDLLEFKQRTQLPVIACLLDVAAGGGYYLATAADVIVAHPTTVTGGIGVILNLYNLREWLSQLNITPQEIKSGKFIDIGTSLRNLPDDAKNILEKMAKEYHNRFQDIVVASRPQLDKKKETIFDGRVFTATEAKTLGLIDRVGYLDDAVQLGREMGRCAEAAPALYRRPNDPARSLYAITPNTPLQSTALPLSIPGVDRSKMPTFLYLWQPEATMPRLSGR
ncbi:MAG: signal peptide peptidase SppA [Gemmataceae bacterium]